MRPVLPAVCSPGIYHHPLPQAFTLLSCPAMLLKCSVMCTAPLGAPQNNPRRLAPGLRASRLPQQMTRASLCPNLCLVTLSDPSPCTVGLLISMLIFNRVK